MTPKEKRFCEEYLVDLNATQAAIRAGYSEDTARSIGSENLTKPDIAELVSQLQIERSDKTKVTAQMVVNELAKLGFSNIKNYFTDDWNIKNVDEITEEQAAAISSVEKVITVTRGETFETEKTTIKFRLHDKKGSLDSLGKHTGVFEKDNKQKSTTKTLVLKPIKPDGTRSDVQ